MDALNRNKSLKQAVKAGNVEMVTDLLKAGVSANLRVYDDAGSLLHHTDSAEIASLLIENGANIEARNRFRFTPLFCAVSKNNVELVEVLLLNGASISAANMKGNTPLHHAVETCVCDRYIVNLLLDHGSSLTALNKLARTPLHAAFENSTVNWDAVDILIENGADINAGDWIGFTPLDIAINTGSCKSWMIKHLISVGARIGKFRNIENDRSPVLFTAVDKKYDAEVIELLIKTCRANPLSLNVHGDHPLLQASYSMDVIKKLIELTTRGTVYEFDFPFEHVPSRIVDSLRSGNYVNMSNKHGHTALLMLLNSRFWTKINLIKELLQQGADVFARDHNIKFSYKGDTPYNIALCILQSFRSISDLCFDETFSQSISIQHSIFNNDFIIYEIIKLFIKYGLLKPDVNINSLQVNNNGENYSFIRTFIQDCQAELLEIEKNYFISPHEFISTSKTVCSPFISDMEERILKLYIDGSFPIYEDVLVMKVKRPVLLKKLQEELNYAKSFRNDFPFGKLNNECLDNFAHYLCDLDLLNLIKAFCKCSLKNYQLTTYSKKTDHLENNVYQLRKICCPHLGKLPDKAYFSPLPEGDSYRLFGRQMISISHYSAVNISLLNLMKSGNCTLSEFKNLIYSGADLNIIDEYCNNLLHLAIQCNAEFEVVNFLLNCGVNMLTMNSFGDNPLHDVLRSFNCSIDIVKSILERSSEIDIYNFNCLSAVPREIVKSLRSGCFVNVSNLIGKTPLHLAVEFSVQLDVIEELLKYGADISAINVDKKTPISIALQSSSFSTDYTKYEITYSECKMQDLLKLFIKYSAIKPNFHDSIFKLSTLNCEGKQFIDNFIQMCKNELSLIEDSFIDGFSFLQIINMCVHLNNSLLLHNNIDEELEFLIKAKFPIYSDIIISNMRRFYFTDFTITSLYFSNK